MKVRVVCPRCAWRYAGVVNADCRRCGGEGLLAAVVPEGGAPWVYARAVTMDDLPPERRREAGLLGDLAGAVGLGGDFPEPLGEKARSAVGREAGKLLTALKLRTPKPRKPPVRKTKEQRVTEQERKARMAAEEAKWRAEAAQRRAAREQAEKEATARAAVLESYRAEDPEDFKSRLEGEMVLVTLAGLPDVRVRGANGNAVVARRSDSP